MSETVYIALGSNIGNRTKYVEDGINSLDNLHNFKLEISSNIYETSPIGKVIQPPFLNAVCKGHWKGTPFQLLSKIQEIEHHFGRQRHIHWGPRTLDIDLLLFGRQIINTKQLTVPHPFMTERDFVLIPLCQIAPTLTHPCSEKPFHEFLESITTSTRPIFGPSINYFKNVKT
ncbi:MAG: 2-amino-4-hydroxy-6-hydroxymethyldihydropteridine diphosphokinase [Candidatus Latescibacterota bacterium]|nr:2-amino-4-hydroxy-6-hydroxymethyldihydropteridine diphosphokinase [Candidatus Latescibacterota bacterium]